MQNSKKERLLMYRIFETETFLKSLDKTLEDKEKKGSLVIPGVSILV